MTELLEFAAIAILVPAFLAMLLGELRPEASTRSVSILVSLIVPAVLAALLGWLYVRSARTAPNPNYSNDDILPGLILGIGPIMVLIAWALGFPAAFEALTWRRRRRGR